MSALADLRAIIVETDECIRWTRSRSSSGYGAVREDGQTRGAHVVVCTWVHGPKPEGCEVAHSCGVRLCVNPRHLRWATHKDNQADRLTHGTHGRGENCGIHKLTESQVRRIRERVAAGEQQRVVAADFGVHATNVHRIVTRKNWFWLP